MVAELRRQSGALTNYWYAAAQSADVDDRRPRARQILGEKLVLWRGPSGRPVAFLDRCLHRNALLSRGALFDGCLGCPYHGWTYDADGRCVDVPSQGPDGGRLDPALRVETFPTCERDGLIWVWMGQDKSPDKLPFSIPYYDADGWGGYYMQTRFENSVINLVENFMDVPHTVFVHRGWFRRRTRTRVPTVVERTTDSVRVTYEQPNDSIGFTERLLNPRRRPMVHTDEFFLPNNTRVDYVFGDHERAFVITSTITPVAAFEAMVYTRISYKLGWLNPVAARLLPWYTRRVIGQDVEIMAIQGEALRHFGAPAFHSTAADLLHAHIETLIAWAAHPDRAPAPEPRVDRMTFWI